MNNPRSGTLELIARLFFLFFLEGGMAGDTIHLMDHIGWVKEREVHVVGVSMGGMIALSEELESLLIPSSDH